MATTRVYSIGTRAADNVTVSSVTGTDPYTVTLSAAVPSTTKIGDSLTDSTAAKFLITNISGSTLTVIKAHFGAANAPATGAATTQRSFATLPSWANAAPASLVTADLVWKGEVWGEGAAESMSTCVINKTTDATHYFWLTAAPGQSFRDHINKLTNPLKYDTAVGAFVNLPGGGITLIQVNSSYTIIENLMFQFADGNATGSCIYFTGNNHKFRNNIFEVSGSAASAAIYRDDGTQSNVEITNNLIILRGSGAQRGIYSNSFFSGGCIITNNTVVRCSDVATNGIGIYTNTSNTIATNNAVFGPFTAAFSGTFSASSGNNATDAASAPGTANQVSLTYANQFVGISTTTKDFRTKTGNSLVNGSRQQAYTNDLDILGQSRSITTPTIGAHEFVSGSQQFNESVSESTTLGMTLSEIVSQPDARTETITLSYTPLSTVTINSVSVSANVTASFAVSETSGGVAGTITTDTIKNNTGSVVPNETNVKYWVRTADANRTPVLSGTNGAINNGIMVITNSAIVPGTTYCLEIELANGAYAVKKFTAA